MQRQVARPAVFFAVGTQDFVTLPLKYHDIRITTIPINSAAMSATKR